MKKHEFYLKNLDCAACANKIQDHISKVDGYNNVVCNFNTLKLIVESNEDEIILDIKEKIEKVEPEVEVYYYNEKDKIEKNDHDEHHHEHEHHHDHDHEHEHHHEHDGRKEMGKASKNIFRIIVGIIVALIGMYVKLPGKLNTFIMILAYVILLFRTGKNSFKLIKKLTIDENLLVTISCIGAFLIGRQSEGLMVIILYEVGKILEDKAVASSRKSIADLMDIRPEYTNLKKGKDVEKVSPEVVNVGDIIVVKQGEKVPIDGIVESGEAHLNTASLTGESSLTKVKAGDKVLSGSINENGLIEIRTTENYENSTVSKILELVENATDKKAKTETFVNRASRIYTPIVVGLATVIGVFMPLVMNVTYHESAYRALLFLVVSCPCAIVISVPLSYFSAIGKASRNGILIKGSNYIDVLNKVSEIAFDKTGTLTKGKFGVDDVVTYGKYSKDELLEYAAYGESFSNHPLGKAIIEAYGKDITESKVKDFEEIAGKGIAYNYSGKNIKLGNADLVGVEKVTDIYGTIVYIQINGAPEGYIVLNDMVKEEAKQVMEELRELKIKTHMFTGDNAETAIALGAELDMSSVTAEMLPQDKYNELEKIIKEAKIDKETVAFVGDGINDAPVLALSDVGLSMGGVGSSSAVEASDVVIMNDDLSKILVLLRIAQFTDMIIEENLVFALLVKLIVLGFGVLGKAQMWEAVFADVGVTLITIINTMRILSHNFNKRSK